MISKTILFCLGTCITFAAIYVDETRGESPADSDVRISGWYFQNTNYSTENMDNYMETMGFSDEARKNIREDKDLMIRITKQYNPAKKIITWTIKKITKKKVWGFTFEHLKEFRSTLLDGRKVNNTVTVNEDKKKPSILRRFKMGPPGRHWEAKSFYEFNKDGFHLTLAAKDAAVELDFNRIDEHVAEQDM